MTAYSQNGKTVYFDCFEEEAENAYAPGDIFLGRVSHIVPNISAAFVEFLPGVNGYLDLRNLLDQGASLNAGGSIPVQVTRTAIGKKEASLTANLQWIGHYVILNLDKRGDGISISARSDSSLDKKRLREELKEHFPEESLILRTNGCELFEESEEAFWPLITEEVLRLKGKKEELLRKIPYQTTKSLLMKSLPDHVISLRDFGLTKIEKIVTDQPDLFEGSCGFSVLKLKPGCAPPDPTGKKKRVGTGIGKTFPRLAADLPPSPFEKEGPDPRGKRVLLQLSALRIQGVETLFEIEQLAEAFQKGVPGKKASFDIVIPVAHQIHGVPGILCPPAGEPGHRAHFACELLQSLRALLIASPEILRHQEKHSILVDLLLRNRENKLVQNMDLLVPISAAGGESQGKLAERVFLLQQVVQLLVKALGQPDLQHQLVIIGSLNRHRPHLLA